MRHFHQWDLATSASGPGALVPVLHVHRAADYRCIPERLTAALLIALLLPAMALIALAIVLTSPGSALYYQVRVGRFGRTFRMVKFRTMVVDAESGTGPVLARPRDPRITAIGRLLRATHLDELPQLWNVVVGHMDFIGPRPERPEFVEEFRGRITSYALRHLVRPGITGLAQVLLPYDAPPEAKLTLDLHYTDSRRDLELDAWIIKATILKMIRAFLPFVPAAATKIAYPRLLRAQYSAQRQNLRTVDALAPTGM